jgi:hypothetical protein
VDALPDVTQARLLGTVPSTAAPKLGKLRQALREEVILRQKEMLEYYNTNEGTLYYMARFFVIVLLVNYRCHAMLITTVSVGMQ